MPDILHDFPIRATPADVFEAVATPHGLDAWWTVTSAGDATAGAEYAFRFGPEYDWRARVTACDHGHRIAWMMTAADADWQGTEVSFTLTAVGAVTQVAFAHTGWPAANAHYRTSTFCWAMYLRLLKRYVERGDIVPYERRLDA
jgi:uncharacterized protein YndB with AHSA1/START domain